MQDNTATGELSLPDYVLESHRHLPTAEEAFSNGVVHHYILIYNKQKRDKLPTGAY